MKKLQLLAALAILSGGSAASPQRSDLPADWATVVASEAYCWGYPLVLMDASRKVMTNFEAPTGKPAQAPVNQFAHAKAFPPASFRDVVRPNFDTLYSIAWLDVGAEPMVLTLPRTDRFHVFQMMDAWSEVFAAPGTRMTGGEGGNYLVANQDWRGAVPAGMQLLRSPTATIWIVGRIQTNGPDDYAFVHGLQAQIALTPLSHFGQEHVPPKSAVDSSIDMKTPPMVAVDGMDGAAFFTTLMRLLAKEAPHVHDQAMVARMRRIGLTADRSFDAAAVAPALQQALRDGAAKGLELIRARARNLTVPRNGWNYTTGAIGSFGADYLFRAAMALIGLGANRPEDAVYPNAQVDGDGQPLTGASRYVLRFPKGQTPPVDAFWSVTMYDGSGFPVENSIGRQAIGDRDRLSYAADGSLEILIQHDAPEEKLRSNWLPAPQGVFALTMRCYSPGTAIASGEWVPPAVARVR